MQDKRISPVIAVALIFLLFSGCTRFSSFPESPNVIWIISEDMNAFIGAYGDKVAKTPHLDQLSRDGTIYTNAYATAPVCSPSRSCLITGLYATSLGSQHLRSKIELPKEIVPFPKLLRSNGYFCTNTGKEDYNFEDSTIWNESSSEAHWKHRKDGQPFFSVLNIGITHQSQIFGSDDAFNKRYGNQLSVNERCDPDSIVVPPYLFDTPIVRKLWARYYDLVTLMDREVGSILQALDDQGLSENTIVFFFSDHGTGMPRSKRALYDSGLKIPLIIRAPVKWQNALDLSAGTIKEDMVSFADFAPTVLNICGVEIPFSMQGKPFLGKNRVKQSYVYGHADRVDEGYEFSRTVRDQRFRYIRNYFPHLPLIQDNFYTDQSEIMQELRRVLALGGLTSPQAAMWEIVRPPEELYDTKTDPYEVNNLVAEQEYLTILNNLRRQHDKWIFDTGDTGFIPESELYSLSKGGSIYSLSRDTVRFPLSRIVRLTDGQVSESWYEKDNYDVLEHPSQLVRFWAATMYEIKYWQADDTQLMLEKRLSDSSSSVRIAAARALCQESLNPKALESLLSSLEDPDDKSRLFAARSLQELSKRFNGISDKIRDFYLGNCPQEDWNKYYELYTCWSLGEIE